MAQYRQKSVATAARRTEEPTVTATPDQSMLAERADTLKALHGNRPVVLPTVWDVWSARFVVDAGFAALTIGSHPVAESLGANDNEGMTPDQAFAAIGRIAAAVEVPVSADVESGYGLPPAELVQRLLAAGAVGLNVEDTVHSENGRLRSAQEHADYIAGVRQAADTAGVHVVINARTDLFKNAADPLPLLDEGLARLQALVDAGADSLYPVRVQSSDQAVRAITDAMPLPVNITARPDRDELARMRELGVGRISFGPLLQKALTGLALDLLGRWR
jgi:2-methylisocitrate lyase-like PEP mutase family enzyme